MAAIDRRAPLTERQVESMLTTFIRQERALETARRQLENDGFAAHHRNLAALWSVVCDHYDEFGGLPDATMVMGELERRFDEDPESLSEEEVQNLDGIIERAYYPPAENFTSRVIQIAFKYLKVYLEDRIADRIRADLTSSTYTPGNLCSVLEGHLAAVTRVQSIEPTGLRKPFPAGWDRMKSAVIKSNTSLPFLNEMLNGGQAVKEVYGILAPHGSCKTTIGIQYSTSQANLLRAEWTAGGQVDPLKIVYVFIYESDVEEMRLRALSSLAGIDRNTLETGEWELLSSRDTLKPYEKRQSAELAKTGRIMLSERERYRFTERSLNVNWRCVDMTGNDPDSPGRGWGLVDEIASVIQMDQEFHKANGMNVAVGPIVIDYAGAAVKRYLDHHNKDHSKEIRHLISAFPMNCKNKLAIRYRTTVIALHQLSGTANAMGSGVLPHSTDAAEAKSWRENLDFSFVAGNPNKDNCVVFGCDKHRRAPGVNQVIIQIKGALCRVEHAPQLTVDPVRRKIVDASELRSIDEGNDDRPSHHTYEEDDEDNDADTMATETNNVRRKPRTERMGGRRADGR